MKHILVAGAALCLVQAVVADGRIVAVDQASTSAVFIENNRVTWRWTPQADRNVKPADRAMFAAIDECKVCDGGATLLVNASCGGVAAIDVAKTNAIWYAKASRGKAGPHSVCRLPDGRVAVANSTGCDALEIIDVRKAPLDPARQTLVRAAEVPGAHGVDWNVRRHSLFVLGYTNLYEFAYLPEKMALVELRRWTYDKVLGDAYGHDLVPDAKGGYFITNHSGVWRIDLETGAFSSVLARKNAKSFSRDSAKGDLVQLPTERFWSDRLVVVGTNGADRIVGPFPGAKFYKARWFSSDARQLKWADEFVGSSLKTNLWGRCKKGKSDWDRHMSERPDLVAVSNGWLVMRGVLNTNTNDDPRPFLTGGVSSRDRATMRLGKVEMRVKFEDHQRGAWPALWMCGNDKDDLGRGWPWNGEIDIVERLNGDDFVYQTVHSGWTFVKRRKWWPTQSGKGAIKKGDWNVYGFEIRADALVWSVNGKETFRYTRADDACDPDHWPFNLNYFFYLDMQLGGDWVGTVDLKTLPVNMYIDWIRVYE